jgi:neutral ceramidase
MLRCLSVQDAKSRRPLAIFASYSLHYVGATPRGLVSADYFGEFSRLMPSGCAAATISSPCWPTAASGDINNIPFLVTRPPRAPFEQIRIVAQKTADAAWHAWRSIEQHRPDAGSAWSSARSRCSCAARLRNRSSAPRRCWPITDEAERAKLPNLAEAYARRTLSLAEADETLSVPLQAYESAIWRSAPSPSKRSSRSVWTSKPAARSRGPW